MRNSLDSIDAEYYFVFPNDMANGNYKSLIDSLVSRRGHVAALVEHKGESHE